MSRRVGISRREKPSRLLKSLIRPETDCPPSNSTSNAFNELPKFGNETRSTISYQDERFIFAEPLSDEDEDFNTKCIPHSSDEEEAGRGDILPTNFSVKGDVHYRPTRGRTDDDGFGPIRDITSNKLGVSQTKSPLRRSRRNGSESANSPPKKARLITADKTKEMEFFPNAPLKSRKKFSKTYGSQSKSRESRTSQSSGEPPTEAVFKKPLPSKSSPVTLPSNDSFVELQPVELDMPGSPEKQFKIPGQVVCEEPEMEAGKVFKTFDIPACSRDSSPEKIPNFNFGPDLSKIPVPEYDIPTFRTAEVRELLKRNGPVAGDSPDRVPLRALENGEDAQSQLRTFRMPSMALGIAANSEHESSEFNRMDENSLEIHPPSPEMAPEATCPMCGDSVDATFLRGYNGGKRMNIRTQTKFCRTHKKRSARSEWAEKGYPIIDWGDFDTRLAQHHSYLKSLLDGESSYYRNILAEQVRSGKDRTLLQAVSNSGNSLTPGYYGTRGFRAMSENIMDKFSSQLRRIAVTDRLVAARGVTGYVQNVLVPELAVRLICEDMGLGAEKARQVMRETVALGDLLNEEVEDIVTWKEGDETL